jgi:hypothetical protein
MMLNCPEESGLHVKTSTYKDDGKDMLSEVFWYHQF